MKLFSALLVLAAMAAYAKKMPVELAGVACQTPPPMHCPDANCPGALVIESGAAVEPKSGRKFFLDYPCDLKKGEKVTFILSLHGFGSYGNWQRHYFPMMDYKEKYRLVIATPNAVAPPPKAWAAVDDEFLQNVVNLVYDQIGKENIKGVLAGRALPGRHDVESDHPHGFFQTESGRLVELVRRKAGRESGARQFLQFDGARSRSGSGRTRELDRCGPSGERVFLHLRNRAERNG